jgi:hypothetical protein
MKITKTVWSLLALIFFLSTGSVLNAAESMPEADCSSSGGLNFICGFSGPPEDLVLVPGTNWVVASAYLSQEPINLYLVNTENKAVTTLYGANAGRDRFNRNRYGVCPGVPDREHMETHGLALKPQAGSEELFNLYAVSHGGRETIEVFELDVSDAAPQITWVGCVPMPAGLDANDVSVMRDGSILATVLMHPGKTFDDLLSGQPTGGVYRWTPGSEGFVMLEGSELPGNNGIQVSADESEIFVAASGLSAVVTLANSNPTRVLRRTRTLPFAPDNVVLDENGYLLTAGMRDDEPVCAGTGLPPVSTCPRGTVAVSIHPLTMKDTTILDATANPAFSRATMAIVTGGNEVWIGSFGTARIAWQVLDETD